MRLPPQGGLPPAGTVGGAVVEIACDESGFSGSNQLVRVKRGRRPDRRKLDRFFQARDALPAHEVLAALAPDRVWDVLSRLADGDGSIPPPLEPLLPALAETVLFWSGGRRRVLVIHDEQSALTAGRLRRLQQVLAADGAPSPLAGLLAVDSRDDPRVQVADLLAGVARRLPGPVEPLLSVMALSG